MPGTNLTKIEAEERKNVIGKVAYTIEVELSESGDTFPSRTVIDFKAKAGASTFVDLIAPEVLSIKLNGQDLGTDCYRDSRIELSNLAANNRLEVVANCAYMHTGEGAHRFTDPADGLTYVYTQFEVPDARRVFACFEQPDLKATYQFSVTVPESWTVLSNMDTPSPQALKMERAGDSQRHRFDFPETPLISTYITALVAGPYHSVKSVLTSIDGRTIPLGVYCRQSLAKYLDADFVLEQTVAGFRFYESRYARPYPFTKYDQIFVPEYNAGAMENAGCITFRDEYIFRTKPSGAQLEQLTNTILHELAHMWFGDLVTMKWWDDLWLNESFAEFMSYWCMAEGTRFSDAWTGFTMRKVWGVNCDQLPTTHPIVAPISDLADVEVNFDGITYSKGACVLRQLVAYVGEGNFLAALRSYFASHEYSNATLADFLGELENASGRSLKQWSQVWLLEAGITQLESRIDRDKDGQVTSFQIVQSLPQEGTSLRPHATTVGAYDFDANGKLVLARRASVDVQGEVTTVPGLVGTKHDVYVLNDQDLAYAKIRFDADSWEVIRTRVGDFADSLPRAVIMCAAWDMVRDGDLSASKYLEMALGALKHETNSSVLNGILRHIQGALAYYAAEPDSAHRLLAPALFALAQKAEPASDRQRQLVRAFLHIAGAKEASEIKGWYEEGKVLEGVSVDTDLRWDMVFALAANGLANADTIRKMAESDDTITGRENAFLARATVPGRENKAQWAQRVLDDTTLTNGQIDALTAGIARSLWLQPADAADIIEPYFAALNDIWSTRTMHMAESLVGGLYPLAVQSREGFDLVERTERWLAENPDADKALRRLVLEELDGARRSKRARTGK
ncbi:aminopeptidase N [Varibaculum prostatecancerukia]|uniref:aminopeptidase N n=1 Tax=Varibaculum prostatecancerukia TaxID=2811781 RepID=UPI001C008BF0|nr:aminopeptidase N [Varibaculum prostatecancerukia]